MRSEIDGFVGKWTLLKLKMCARV